MIKRIKDILHKISNKQIYLISFIVALIDQITKSLIIHNLILAKETVIIPNFFSLIYVTNTGAAFSSLSNKTSLLIIMSLFCLALIMTIIQKEKNNSILKTTSLGILVGGIVGNLIDRIVHRHVIDFIAITILKYKFPVFNVADICITCGVFIYVIITFIEENKIKKRCINDKSRRRNK